jgi:LmbE family N-acetylglucosaminyl deacetylase
LYFTELLSEGLEPWIVREVFMFNWQIDTSDPSSIFQVDITETFPLKASALLEHKSQISDPSAVVEDIMDMATVLAKASKPEMGFMSEWFKRVLFR